MTIATGPAATPGGGFGARLSRLTAAAGDTGLLPLLLLIGLYGAINFDVQAFGVLSPDIRRTFHLSTGAIDNVAALTAAVPVALSFYLGYLGDRMNRLLLSAACGTLWAVTAIFTGLAPVVGVLIAARLVGGIGFLAGETVFPPLLSDYYKPEGLGTIFGSYRFLAQGLALSAGPLSGVLAAVFGHDGWRFAFVVLALPTFVFVLLLRLLKEPPRGMSLGLSVSAQSQAQMSIMEGYRRVRAIRTARRTWFSAFLFGAGTLPFATLLSNFFKDVYHYGDTRRGEVALLFGLLGLLGVGIGGVLAQRLTGSGRFRLMPVVNMIFILDLAVGILVMAATHDVVVSLVGTGIAGIGAIGFLPVYTTLVSIIAPPALRAQAFGWTLLFYALGGVSLQALVISPLINVHGERVAFLVLAGVVAAGGLVGGTTAKFIEFDIGQARRQERAARSEALLSCNGVDVAYGGVQVLFGVDFELHRGEMVALLGTNGAGKSTFLKAVSGLLDPIGGAMYFKGRDITHADPMATARMGIMQVPGGRGIFPTLSVAENLRVAGWMYRKDRKYVAEATQRVMDQFPILRERASAMAGDLSGGEQQMLSLAQAFIAQPDLLLIDELSLGLAPAIVSRLLDIVRSIHASGTTVLLVEQSVNTALELAERAVFMEKGEVRFSGPTKELLDRPDILRAVFLQGAAAAAGPDESGTGATGNGAAGGRRPTRRDRAALPSRPAPAELLREPVVLSIRGLTKRYGGVTAVQGVDLDLHHGEILGLIGPNGAGKTTLFDLITGFTPPDGGRVVLHDRDVSHLGAWQRAALGLGRSFQDARLWPSLTVVESLAVALHDEAEIQAAFPALMGLPRVAESEEDLAEKVDELVELMGLNAFRNKFISELSTGSRRIVELACMLAHRPSVLLLDEPSSGIAQRETEALGPLLLRIRDQLDCSILIIEHDMPLISTLADHMIGLDLGRVIAYGSPREVLEDPHVVESYLGTGAGNLELAGPGPASRRGRSRTGNGHG
jgi:ABC-type branched-subunit amino acid transport system ATPase component/predicted MFS family arabinose efflux permease